MKMLKLIFKNSFRHRLRAFLTIAGVAAAVITFTVFRTAITSWNAGVDAAAADRLVTRQAVSFIFPLPISYKDRIEKINGVQKVMPCLWFQGKHWDETNFFARIAVVPESVREMFPEYIVSDAELEAFKKERTSCLIGVKTAKRYNLKLGDVIPIEGDIYPGTWQFTVRGIYQPREEVTDATQMFIHYDYVDERVKQDDPSRAGGVGWYSVKIKDISKSAEISQQIDALFANSSSETKTETEKAFNQGFLSAFSAVITVIDVASLFVIVIIMFVLGNTMVMSSRERTREYAVLKTLGFKGWYLYLFITGESIVISLIGAIAGVVLSYPIVYLLSLMLAGGGMFPVFYIVKGTLIVAFISALVVGVISAVIPVVQVNRTRIVDGLRYVG
ncbi:MAG: FtsX-like permease family protein [Candidatus Kapaibacterium sp.]|nr:FtsX-like permease family protein [Bacteroidota bacterium]